MIDVCIELIIGFDLRVIVGSDVMLETIFEVGLVLWFIKGSDVGLMICSWFLFDKILDSPVEDRIGGVFYSLTIWAYDSDF